MPERAYLSIGEVLSLLKDEFADITISKIRFLESQGLLDPERTPSGYRKFYEADVERLRWILRQQREHFLPLKVIKGRLGADEDDAGRATGGVVTAERLEAAKSPPPEPSTPSAPPERQPFRSYGQAPPEPTPERARIFEPEPRLDPALAPAPPPPPAAGTRRAPVGAALPGSTPPRESPLSSGLSGLHLTIDELASASGLTHGQIRELEGYQLLAGRASVGTTYYDEEALVVANLAAGFLRFGVEARHLRAYKSAAEREAGQFEQVVLPLLKQRNPHARQQATDTLADLSKLAQGLRAAFLRQSLKDITGG
jgi:DNA-binding transcriptional MerR regulator